MEKGRTREKKKIKVVVVFKKGFRSRVNYKMDADLCSVETEENDGFFFVPLIRFYSFCYFNFATNFFTNKTAKAPQKKKSDSVNTQRNAWRHEPVSGLYCDTPSSFFSIADSNVYYRKKINDNYKILLCSELDS